MFSLENITKRSVVINKLLNTLIVFYIKYIIFYNIIIIIYYFNIII